MHCVSRKESSVAGLPQGLDCVPFSCDLPCPTLSGGALSLAFQPCRHSPIAIPRYSHALAKAVRRMHNVFGLIPTESETQMTKIKTPRLVLSELSEQDAPLMLAVLNDADFLRNVGDRGVRTLADARRHIIDGPTEMYRQYNFGLYKVELADGTAIGTCGLLRRDGLDDADIGFAFLPEYRGKGYALEAAEAVMEYGRDVIGLERIVAIAQPDNKASIGLLGKIGLKPEGRITLPNDDKELVLMAWEIGGK